MGVDTKGELVTNPDPYVVKEFLGKQQNTSECELDRVDENDTYILTRILLKQGDNDKYRSIIFGQDKNNHKTSILMGADEEGKQIIKSVVQNFGGYFLENDTNDDWQYIPAENKDHELTEKENVFYKLMEILPDDLEDKNKVARYIADNSDDVLQAIQGEPGDNMDLRPR